MGTEVRIFLRIIIETLNSIKRANWMNWVIITTMAAILSIFGCMFRLTIAIDTIVKQLGANLQISVYLQDDTDSAKFLEQAKLIPEIKDISLKTKEEAWNDIKKQFTVMDMTNPLPDTLHIRVIKSELIQSTVEKLKKMDGVESVNYPEAIAKHMRKLASATTFVTILLIVLLGSLTLFIISNTIQLLIQSCSREIEIMSMMGVGSWFIKIPYLLQGSFYGISGSILALIPLYILQSYIVKAYSYFGATPPQLSMNIVVLAILAMGLIVGSSGSLISVQKHLKI
ncbi:MAG: permease-like cell division protein FtsX [Cyanobacteriota bacterium]